MTAAARNRTPTPRSVVEALASLQFDGVFNPYRDRCDAHDLPDAPGIRRSNLLKTFEAARGGVDELWIALEPGHRGARRTGLAMTDERRLVDHAARWGLRGVERATVTGPETEQTAGIVWEALERTRASVMLWNVFPLHCHKPLLPLSNRRHTVAERTACSDLTAGIIAMLAPKRIVAIGGNAQDAMAAAGFDFSPVRHPAYGGKVEFLAGVCARA